ncbi:MULTISPECIES: hypothetical protein [Microvirga]|nr:MULTISPECIES: hypothetical protein [unclassified Microvirga]
MGTRLSDHPGSVDDFVREYRLAPASAAFVVGVALGRLMARA